MDSAVARPSWPRGRRDARDSGIESQHQTGLTSEIQGFSSGKGVMAVFNLMEGIELKYGFQGRSSQNGFAPAFQLIFPGLFQFFG